MQTECLILCEAERLLQIAVISTYLGDATSNQAEYSALILGLEVCFCLHARVQPLP